MYMLKGMYDSFLSTIPDAHIQDEIKNNSYIAGGCIPSMLLDEFVTDFDFYFRTPESAKIVKDYFTAHKALRADKFKVQLITDNAINLSDKVQLITRFTGDPSDVISEFDWEHLCSYFKYPDGLVIPDKVYKLLLEKKLSYTGSKYPLSSFFRLKKYLKKGWDVDTATMLHIALDIATNLKTRKKEDSFYDRYHSDDLYTQEQIGDRDDEVIQDDVKISVESLIHHMNGVDPLIIQRKLQHECGAYLSIPRILELIEG